MTADKTSLIRSYILDLLEKGIICSDDKIPGARDLASELKVSFLKVQQALETLARDGILETRGRVGTFVQQGWEERVLHDNISVFNKADQLPWISGLTDIIAEHIPGLRFTHAFKKGMLEIKTTLYVQENHEQFMDMSEIFKECFPDESIFFEDAFIPFKLENKLIGIPFSFSPRVLYYNPELFEKAGIPCPEGSWTWEEFVDDVRKFKEILPVDKIINIIPQTFYWLNIVHRSGGHIFENRKVDIGSNETVRGLKLFAELWKEVENSQIDGRDFANSFFKGEAAMFIGGRQFVSQLKVKNADDWKTVALPHISGGRDVTSQATDLLCIRKSCTSMALARKYVQIMLSEQVQDYIGRHKYAIPIRKSSAFKSIDLTDPRDSLFAVEMGKLASEPLAEHPELARLLVSGMDRILTDCMDIDSGIKELLMASKVFVGIQEHREQRVQYENQLSIA